MICNQPNLYLNETRNILTYSC